MLEEAGWIVCQCYIKNSLWDMRWPESVWKLEQETRSRYRLGLSY